MASREPTTGEERPVQKEDWLLACFQKALGHELPNQLVATQGLLRLLELEEGERLSDDGRDYLRRLSAGAERSHALIHGLAEIVRAARSTEPAQPVPLPEVVREVAAEMKQLFAPRSIVFQYGILIPVLRVPPQGFRQVLVHLFRHALQSVEDNTNPRIEVSARLAGDGVEVSVADNGRGLSADGPHRLFEPFAGAEEVSGYRLGLVLVRTLLDHWGGTVRVQAGTDQGKTVTLWLPRRP